MADKIPTDRGIVVENPLPYAPGNIKLSRDQFIAQRKAKKEKDLKIKEFAKSLENTDNKKEPKIGPVEEVAKAEKPRGRPRKIL